MNKRLSILQVGIGGYGNHYLYNLLENEDAKGFRLTGAVDTNPENSDFYNDLCKKNITIYRDLKEYYNKSSVDLTIISSPIHFHEAHTLYA